MLDQNSKLDSLFVSSDEQRFVDFIEKKFSHTLPVIYHDDQERFRTTVAVHRSKQGDGYKKAHEAVLNCLLLSRCNALIKSASFLSGWSKLFNPGLPVILLNRRLNVSSGSQTENLCRSLRLNGYRRVAEASGLSIQSDLAKDAVGKG